MGSGEWGGGSEFNYNKNKYCTISTKQISLIWGIYVLETIYPRYLRLIPYL